MKVTLLDYTKDAARFIGYCASICYDSDTSYDACIRRAGKCKDSGHLATMRFAYATFHIADISRACSHQLVRHKHLDYLQRSQRYVKEKDATFVMPPNLTEDQQAMLLASYSDAQQSYSKLLDMGVKKEDARMVLPNGTTTDIIVTGNLQGWYDFVRLRTDKAAQYEIRQVANEIKFFLETIIAPEVFASDHS